MRIIFRSGVALILVLIISFGGGSSLAVGASLENEHGSYEVLPNSQVDIYASSEQSDRYGYYRAENANDADNRTTWSEGASGNGIGEWIMLVFPRQKISGFVIRAGYHKSKDVYQKNSRPQDIIVFLADGSTGTTVRLQDVRDVQVVLFDQPVSTDSLTIEIASVYSGWKYKDTCITDIGIIPTTAESPQVVAGTWDEQYRLFIQNNFYDFYQWNWMKLVDLDWDGVPELLVCIDEGHVSKFIIVSSLDISTWHEMNYADISDEKILLQYRNIATGGTFWLSFDRYIMQEEYYDTIETFDYSVESVWIEPLFRSTDHWEDLKENFGERHFYWRGDEVPQDTYDQEYERFFSENAPFHFMISQSHGTSTTVSDALFRFDSMVGGYW